MNKHPKPPAQRGHSYAVFASIVAVILRRPQTARSLARTARISETAARNFLRAMHQARCIYVKAYARGRGNRLGMRVFEIGSEPDAARPARMTPAERTRQWRIRRKTLGGAWRHQVNN